MKIISGRRMALAFGLVLLLTLGACQKADVTETKDGINVAADPGDAEVSQLAQSAANSYSDIFQATPRNIEKTIVGNNGESLTIKAMVSLPDVENVTSFLLKPIPADMDLAKSVFWGERSQLAVSNGDNSCKLETDDGRTEILRWNSNGMNSKQDYRFYFDAKYLKAADASDVDLDKAYNVLLDVLKLFGIPNVSVSYVSSYDGTVAIMFVPRFTAFEAVAGKFIDTPVDAQIAVRSVGIEYLQGNFMLLPSDESPLVKLLSLDEALHVVQKRVGADIAVNDKVYVKSIDIRHIYKLNDARDRVTANPVWYFNTNVEDVRDSITDSVPTASFSVDAVSGELEIFY